MSAAAAGWIVLGVCCLAALTLVAIGAVSALMQYRALDRTLQRLKETQRLRFDPARFEAVAARLSSGAEEFVALAARARRASDTLLRALRCATLALRVARRLPWP